ncbi:MAG: 1,4-dihydroxy-2-naphthoate polyprenyltransferase [Propionibacteriaceae bacterium]|jgi:1,4-dihydroxy-2-naphthoate octaprenyltransferase|nr:1,4-dihydroxy-2-naphthoate polyprenyltransferase [Propionibacteriaceae bacterium]
MASLREWVEGARLRTLAACVSPVIAGSGLVWFASPTSAPRATWSVTVDTLISAVLCLIVALGFQVGSNFANDYSDGIRGTDDDRVGPMRLVGSGAAKPGQVKAAAWVCFAIACAAGMVAVARLILAWWRSSADHAIGGSMVAWILVVLVGLACVAAAWFYTGGRHPYGYRGAGEIAVFVFFGLVATLGTTYFVSGGAVSNCDRPSGCEVSVAWPAAIVTAVVMGLMAMAILVANNLRDVDTDAKSGKITLAVRLGESRTRGLYLALVVVAGLGVVVVGLMTTLFAWIGLAGLLVAVPSVRRVVTGERGRQLVAVLKRTGLAELACALGLSAGWMMGWLYG